MYKEILFLLTERDLQYVGRDSVGADRMGYQLVRKCDHLPLVKFLFYRFSSVFIGKSSCIADEDYEWTFSHLLRLRNITLNPLLEKLKEEKIFKVEGSSSAGMTYSDFMRVISLGIAEQLDEGYAVFTSLVDGTKEMEVSSFYGNIGGISKVIIALYSYDHYSFDDLIMFKKYLLNTRFFNQLKYGSNAEKREVFSVGLTKIIKGLELENNKRVEEVAKYRKNYSEPSDEAKQIISQLEEEEIQVIKRIDYFKTAREKMTKK